MTYLNFASNMHTLLTKSHNSLMSGKLFLGSPIRAKYMWNNIIIEKRTSLNWARRLYKDSILHNIIAVLTSPVR